MRLAFADMYKDVNFMYKLSIIFHAHTHTQDFAMLDPTFNSTFTCPVDPANENIILGSIRAMCRICKNISNPDNGLILKGNYQCFAPGLVRDFGCLLDLAKGIKECLPFVSSFSSSSSKGVTVKADYGGHVNDRGTRQLQYLAMAFRSVSFLYFMFCCVLLHPRGKSSHN